MVDVASYGFDGKGEDEIEGWIFVSPEEQYDVGFRHHALERTWSTKSAGRMYHN